MSVVARSALMQPVLAPGPDGALVAAELRGILGALEAVVPPPRELGGWQSLCAAEYALAVLRLEQDLAGARAALAAAIGAVAR